VANISEVVWLGLDSLVKREEIKANFFLIGGLTRFFVCKVFDYDLSCNNFFYFFAGVVIWNSSNRMDINNYLLFFW